MAAMDTSVLYGFEMDPTLLSSPSAGSTPNGQPVKRRRALSKDGKEKRERCANACSRCKAKKLKCYRSNANELSCAACIKASEECVFDEGKGGGTSKSVAMLEERVKRLEKALLATDPNHPELSTRYNSQRPADKQAPSPTSSTGQQGAFGVSRMLAPNVVRRTLKPLGSNPANLGAFFEYIPPAPANPEPSFPPPVIADRIFNTVYLHVHCRYPFLDWRKLRSWWAKAEKLGTSLDDQIGAYFAWMICAVGVQIDPKLKGVDNPGTYFERAWRHADGFMSVYDLTTLQALLLATLYAFRTPSGPSLALLGGMAIRMCADLGLHRKALSIDPVEDEQRKRIFWSAYAFDRQIALSYGRPVGLADADIDADLPLDVDSDTTDPVIFIERLAAPQTSNPENITDMTSAVHTLKYHRLRSKIHTALYAVDAPMPTTEVTMGLLAELEDWRNETPKYWPPGVPMGAQNRFQLRYYQAVLLALRPSVLNALPTDPCLTLCANAAVELFEVDRDVHQGPLSKQATSSVCNTFVCGMTLLFCLSVSPNVIARKQSSRAFRSCSATLAIFAQVFPEARPFYELFEHIADEVLNGEPSEASHSAAAIRHMLEGNYEAIAAIYNSMEHPQQHNGSVQMTGQATGAEPVHTGMTPYFANPNPDEFNIMTLASIGNNLDFTFNDTDMRWTDPTDNW